MPLFKRIKYYFSACAKSFQQLTIKNDKDSRGIIKHLNKAECLGVAGGPQVRNETDVE